MKVANHISSDFGCELESAGSISSILNSNVSIPKLLREKQFLLVRNLSLNLDQLLEVASLFGQPEIAWEDVHPENEFVQLLDSSTQVKISRKSSSKHWHIDRSFMPKPTRFTFLYAAEANGESNGTQILDGRRLLNSLPPEVLADIIGLEAWHSFSAKFPNIMGDKNYDKKKINRLKEMYPRVRHPLIRNIDGKMSLYYSELCYDGLFDRDKACSKKFAELIEKQIDTMPIFENKWRKGDLLIWDNFSTIHRANPKGLPGRRVLHRASVGDGLG